MIAACSRLTVKSQHRTILKRTPDTNGIQQVPDHQRAQREGRSVSICHREGAVFVASWGFWVRDATEGGAAGSADHGLATGVHSRGAVASGISVSIIVCQGSTLVTHFPSLFAVRVGLCFVLCFVRVLRPRRRFVTHFGVSWSKVRHNRKGSPR